MQNHMEQSGTNRKEFAFNLNFNDHDSLKLYVAILE